MRQLLLCCLSLSLLTFAANKDRDWKTGKVADSSMSSREYTGSAATTATTTGTVSPDYGGGSNVHSTTTASTVVRHIDVDSDNLMVVGSDFIYTVRDSTRHGGGPLTVTVLNPMANRKHGCRFVVGDDIKYAQDKRKLYVLDADGKECKLDIVRQERVSILAQPPIKPSVEQPVHADGAADQEAPMRSLGFYNGRAWLELSQDARLSYVIGALDGARTGTWIESVGTKDANTTVDWLAGETVSNGEVRKFLNQFFAHPENTNLPVVFGMHIFMLTVSGASAAEIDGQIRAARADFSQ